MRPCLKLTNQKETKQMINNANCRDFLWNETVPPGEKGEPVTVRKFTKPKLRRFINRKDSHGF